jgi:mRNA-degrading endonuclease RelE of RelBE toxin-antitoxin system
VYEIEWSEQARTDLKALPAFWRRRIAVAVEQLVHQAELETRNRKRLRSVIADCWDAEWNLRVGDLRVLYRVLDGRIAHILRVILKGRATTADALGRVK